MKKLLFFILVSFLLSFETYANPNIDTELDQFIDDISLCKSTYPDPQDINNLNPIEWQSTIYKRMDCYMDIHQKITQRFYKEKQEEMQKSLDTYLPVLYDANAALILNPDVMQGNNGLIYLALYARNTSDDFENYLYRMINWIEIANNP